MLDGDILLVDNPEKYPPPQEVEEPRPEKDFHPLQGRLQLSRPIKIFVQHPRSSGARRT